MLKNVFDATPARNKNIKINFNWIRFLIFSLICFVIISKTFCSNKVFFFFFSFYHFTFCLSSQKFSIFKIIVCKQFACCSVISKIFFRHSKLVVIVPKVINYTIIWRKICFDSHMALQCLQLKTKIWVSMLMLRSTAKKL